MLVQVETKIGSTSGVSAWLSKDYETRDPCMQAYTIAAGAIPTVIGAVVGLLYPVAGAIVGLLGLFGLLLPPWKVHHRED